MKNKQIENLETNVLAVFLLLLFVQACVIVGIWQEKDAIDNQFEANAKQFVKLEEEISTINQTFEQINQESIDYNAVPRGETNGTE